MKRVKIFFIASLVLITMTGCVKMRDYVGVRDGAFGVDLQTGLGTGADKKDYYMINEDTAIILGDTKNEIIQKMGLPSEVGTTLEGYETWSYAEEKIELIFKGDRLGGWTSI